MEQEEYVPCDLIRVSWQDALTTAFEKCLISELKDLIQSWLTSPSLQPDTHATWEEYESLSKSDMLKRLREIDYPQGLYMIQYSQMERAGLFRRKIVRKWMAWKMISSDHQYIDVSMTMFTVRQRLQEYLSKFFKCHVYGFNEGDSGTDWYRIMIFDNHYEEKIPTKAAIVIHYRHTEFLLISSSTKIDSDYLDQAVVHTFKAQQLKKLPLTAGALEKLTQLMERRNTLGVFGQFRYKQQDPLQNPLSFGRSIFTETSKDNTGDDSGDNGDNENVDEEGNNKDNNGKDETLLTDQQYAKMAFTASKEQQRRIIPIHQSKMTRRYDHVEQVFGNYPLEGPDTLDMKLRLSVKPVLCKHGLETEEGERDGSDDDDDQRSNSETGVTGSLFSDDNEGTDNDDGDKEGLDKDNISSNDENETDNQERYSSDNSMSGHTRSKKNRRKAKDKYIMTMGVTFKGKNVMEGLRSLALQGHMEPPYPPWMTDLVASSANQISITKNNMYFTTDD